MDNPLDVVLVGDVGVGKRSIKSRFFDEDDFIYGLFLAPILSLIMSSDLLKRL